MYAQIIGHNKWENSFFVKKPELNKESQEHDSNGDSDPKTCMECSEVFMNRSDLSNHHGKTE